MIGFFIICLSSLFNNANISLKGELETCLNGEFPFINNLSCFANKDQQNQKKDQHIAKEDSVPKPIQPRKQPGIYLIGCIENDYRYYGESSNVSGRLASHRSQLTNQIHHNRSLQADWNLYDSKSFEFVVLYMGEQWKDSSIRRGKESELIVLDRHICYNILETYSRPGELNAFYKRLHTEESKKKIADALKGRPNDLLGRKVSINGIIYASIAEASRQTGEARQTIRKRIIQNIYFAIDESHKVERPSEEE